MCVLMRKGGHGLDGAEKIMCTGSRTKQPTLSEKLTVSGQQEGANHIQKGVLAAVSSIVWKRRRQRYHIRYTVYWLLSGRSAERVVHM